MSTSMAHVYVLTGATGELGHVIARELAQGGDTAGEKRHLVLVGRSRRTLETLSAQVVNSHTRTYIVADNDLVEVGPATEAIMAEFERVVQETGAQRLTLVHCAGSLGDLSKSVRDYTPEEIAHYVAVNYTSFAALTARFLGFAPSTADRVAVVNISSLLAVAAYPNWGLYSSIKAARDQLLKVAALEYRDDARVKMLSYAPGPLNNAMQDEVRRTIGDPEQRGIYARLHADRQLVEPETTAALLCSLLDRWTFQSGEHIDIYDLISPPS
ncbi:hypothetical protein GGF46_003394 [Coemansia sp. RSA 552]|nr:hypothetical protein GGF46_003394 [Coemansia sp. RSA 552]